MAAKKTTTKRKGGPRPQYTPQELAEKLDEIFAECTATDTFPSNHLLTERLHVSPALIGYWWKLYNRDQAQQDEEIEKNPAAPTVVIDSTIDTVDIDKDGKEKVIYISYSQCMQKLIDYREHFLLQRGMHKTNAQSIAIFALKQAHNGGYLERPKDGGGQVAVTVKFAGSGGDPFG